MHDSHDRENPLLTVTDVTKTFATPKGPLTIIERATLSVQRGEKVAIVGPSGSGKSTLLSMLGLLDVPTTGSITLSGTPTASLTESEQARFRNEHIGFILQSYELIAPFTVTENVEAPLLIGGKKSNTSRIAEILSSVGLSERAHALPYTLSGGEKQRVAIARAIVNEPTLILADEPTGSLDHATGERVLDILIREVTKEKRTLIMITHDESIATRVDRVLFIRDGVVYER